MSFGTKFIIVNDVQQALDPKKFGGGHFVHHATIVRGFKEYMLYRQVGNHRLFIEEVDPKEPGLFKKIEDDIEWKELVSFCHASGLLDVAKEIKVGKDGLPGA